MIDENFYKKTGEYTIQYIADITKCRVNTLNFDKVIIKSVNSLHSAIAGDISFLFNKKYLPGFYTTKATACIVSNEISSSTNPDVILLHSDNPHYSYQQLIKLFYTTAKSYNHYISPSAYIASTAKLGENCYIGHNVVIGDNVTIGDSSIIESGSVIGDGVAIGNNAHIHSNVSINYSIIGDDVVILAGARIGQDGFGFATENSIHCKIFHVGRVIIGDDVEIGANSTIDRGSIGDTVIENGVRIDNLVQIAHGVHIGCGTIIVAQTGIAGSSRIGNYCQLGGQSGINGHIKIGDYSQIAAQSGVISDLESKSVVCGMPAVPIMQWRRQNVILKNMSKK